LKKSCTFIILNKLYSINFWQFWKNQLLFYNIWETICIFILYLFYKNGSLIYTITFLKLFFKCSSFMTSIYITIYLTKCIFLSNLCNYLSIYWHQSIQPNYISRCTFNCLSTTGSTTFQQPCHHFDFWSPSHPFNSKVIFLIICGYFGKCSNLLCVKHLMSIRHCTYNEHVERI